MVAIKLQVISRFLQSIQKTVFLFLQTRTKNTLWVKKTVLPTEMTKFSSYRIAEIKLYC